MDGRDGVNEQHIDSIEHNRHNTTQHNTSSQDKPQCLPADVFTTWLFAALVLLIPPPWLFLFVLGVFFLFLFLFGLSVLGSRLVFVGSRYLLLCSALAGRFSIFYLVLVLFFIYHYTYLSLGQAGRQRRSGRKVLAKAHCIYPSMH
ncbi:hypothetical protein B0T22DRAFT_467976, partial [Podospora appendiculata]